MLDGEESGGLMVPGEQQVWRRGRSMTKGLAETRLVGSFQSPYR
jgi:hypothetical protein